jgi:hypothetical protein
MQSQRIRRAILGVLGALVVAAAASGITYAATATTPQVLHACSNAHGMLRLLQNGHCPHGFSKVSLNKQGPRGLTGARGATGPAGPRPFTVRAASDNATSSFQDHPIDGLGLTVHPVCNVAAGSSSGLYLHDTTGSVGYTVNGSYNLTANGAHALLVYNGGSHPNLAPDLGLVEFDQPAQVGANAEFVVQYDAGAGGQLAADVVVTRSGKKVLIHLFLSQSSTHCVAQAEVTPAV